MCIGGMFECVGGMSVCIGGMFECVGGMSVCIGGMFDCGHARACLPLFNELISSLQDSPVPATDDVNNCCLGIIKRLGQPLLHCSKNVFAFHVYSVIELVSSRHKNKKKTKDALENKKKTKNL